MDDDLDDIDFSAIDQIVENHQAKQRVRVLLASLNIAACQRMNCG